MTSRTDHSRLRQRDQMRRFGGESASGKRLPPAGAGRRWKPARVKATKAELRAIADRAFAEWSATRTSS